MSTPPEEVNKAPKRGPLSLAFFLLLILLVQIVGGIWTRQSVETWYPTLAKASWNPPSWVFGPVWSVLYLMIAVSGWLLYNAPPSPKRNTALAFFAVQLTLNFIWSYLFFALRSPFLALIDSVLLLTFIILTLFAALKVHRLAALLLIPYALWAFYATTLNAATWLLNDACRNNLFCNL